MLKPDLVNMPTTQVKQLSSAGSQALLPDNNACTTLADIPMVTPRRRKSHPCRPVDDDEEIDGAQADEEPLAGTRVRTGLANVDTPRWSVVVTASQ